jgi:hypothetical protein
MIDNGPGLDQFQQRQAMERQAARALFDASMSDAHDRLQREDFARARRSVEGAIARLDRSDEVNLLLGHGVCDIQFMKTMSGQIDLILRLPPQHFCVHVRSLHVVNGHVHLTLKHQKVLSQPVFPWLAAVETDQDLDRYQSLSRPFVGLR